MKLKKHIILLVLPFVAFTMHSSASELTPGLYQISLSVEGMGLPAGSVEETSEECLTKEDLAENASGALGADASMEECEISHYDWSNGSISMKMTCSVHGADATGESKGSYTATGYDMVTTMKIDVQGTVVEMKTAIRGERIGDC